MAPRATSAVMSGRLLIGTSSWTDKSLVDSGLFYPPDCTSPEARLRFYARHFSVVQNDAAWYALPASSTTARWVERTPPGFVFDVKLFRLFTQHATPLKSLPADLRTALPPKALTRSDHVYFHSTPPPVWEEILRRYLEAVEPLRTAGKLGILLIQLAPWASATRKTVGHLELLRRKLAGWPLAVEFRHAGWYAEGTRARTMALLRDLEMAHVVVDEPSAGVHSVPMDPEVTWDHCSVLRLHGRNAETWNKKGLTSSAQRFDYEYSDQELSGLVPVARTLAEQAAEVHVMVNVNQADQGVRAATRMQHLLGEEPYRPVKRPGQGALFDPRPSPGGQLH